VEGCGILTIVRNSAGRQENAALCADVLALQESDRPEMPKLFVFSYEK
jgi:hypothetical protein